MKFKPVTVCVMAVWGFVTAAGCFAVDPTTEHTKWLLLVVAFGEVSYVDKIGEKVLPPEIANNRANSSSDTPAIFGTLRKIMVWGHQLLCTHAWPHNGKQLTQSLWLLWFHKAHGWFGGVLERHLPRNLMIDAEAHSQRCSRGILNLARANKSQTIYIFFLMVKKNLFMPLTFLHTRGLGWPSRNDNINMANKTRCWLSVPSQDRTDSGPSH